MVTVLAAAVGVGAWRMASRTTISAGQVYVDPTMTQFYPGSVMPWGIAPPAHADGARSETAPTWIPASPPGCSPKCDTAHWTDGVPAVAVRGLVARATGAQVLQWYARHFMAQGWRFADAYPGGGDAVAGWPAGATLTLASTNALLVVEAAYRPQADADELTLDNDPPLYADGHYEIAGSLSGKSGLTLYMVGLERCNLCSHLAANQDIPAPSDDVPQPLLAACQPIESPASIGLTGALQVRLDRGCRYPDEQTEPGCARLRSDWTYDDWAYSFTDGAFDYLYDADIPDGGFGLARVGPYSTDYRFWRRPPGTQPRAQFRSDGSVQVEDNLAASGGGTVTLQLSAACTSFLGFD